MVETLNEVKGTYFLIKDEIEDRLEEFQEKGRSGSDEEIFTELVFCLLTPQSKAKSCWLAIQNLINNNLIFQGSASEISEGLNIVRFRNNKARYIVEAREFFTNYEEISIKSMLTQQKNVFSKREWLVKDVKGIGYKEASHFLRNIGFGKQIAILDRHILKNLKLYGVIGDIPKMLSRKKYFEIEKKMMDFSKEIEIPMSHLDLLFWYKETGEIFK
ncbi:MAG: N-glycosylase/DNA lyase [Candidatus Marinimicrobia bacterium]|nr:N-glycosylase/DNA lyase [Candidatus Neomarinimicrobiota bacterium]